MPLTQLQASGGDHPRGALNQVGMKHCPAAIPAAVHDTVAAVGGLEAECERARSIAVDGEPLLHQPGNYAHPIEGQLRGGLHVNEAVTSGQRIVQMRRGTIGGGQRAGDTALG